MQELLMVNPRKRRKTTRRKKRTSVRRRRNPVAAYVRNPVRRRRSPARRVARRRTAVRRYRRNPNGRLDIQGTLIPAAQAAGGALALDVLWGFFPIPDNLKTGPMRYIAKGVGAFSMLWLGDMIFSRTIAKNMAQGALTVIMHDAFREVAQTAMPNVPLDGVGYYSAGWPAGGGVGEYTQSDRLSGLDAYMPGDLPNYLESDPLSAPFRGPGEVERAFSEGEVSCLESENNNVSGVWY